MSESIPQRELRNNVGAVLRAAESGTVYTVTVDGRPVAELGPHRPRRWIGRDEVMALLSTPTDETLLDAVAATDLDAGLDHDPWAEA
jgi:prevent-host-death family protein